jgi:hypothetical protein
MEAALRDGAAAFCKVTSALVTRPHGLAVATLSGSRGGGDPWGSSDCWFRHMLGTCTLLGVGKR